MTTTMSNIENRHIRVFVSSTFRDMQEEREYLREKVYPELRVEFARRYVDLTFIDLTWGVTEEQSKSGRTMEICLRQIEKSRPFFIGILGSRYGTFPKIDFLEMNPHLKDWTWLPKDIEDELSNTEIEIQYGALRPEEKTHAFFYFCKEDRPTGESKEADARQKCLKETIIKDKRYPVSYYSTPEEFGLLVKENLKGLFNQLFPPLQLPEMELEDKLQDFFLKSHTRAYVPAGDYLNDIDAFIKDSEKQGLLITSAPGMGKSALIANWLSRHEDGRDKNIIYHFVGAGNLQGRHTKIAEHLAWQIRKKYGLPEKKAEKEDPVKMLSGYIWKASEREPQLVIVIDGINQIKDEDNAKLLTWLIYSHKNVKYILTTLKEDRTMERPQRENYVQLEIKPLNETHDNDQREEMAVCYLDYFGQQLSDTQRNLFCSDDKCRNPLILKSLLDELRIIGIHEKLTDQIESYLATSDINGFFQKILAHYEAAFGLKQVKTVLGLIAYSRDGMREEELREISGIEESDWYQLFGTIYNHLIYRNGLWGFNNSYILEAVRSRYGSPKTFRRKIVKYMEDVPGDNNPEERKERQIRAYEELPYQYWLMKDYERLHDYILQLDVFEYIYERHAFDLAEYWRKLLKIRGNKYSLSDYLKRDAVSETETARFYNNIGYFVFQYFSFFDIALKYYEKSLKLKERIYDSNSIEIAISYDNIGLVYHDLGKYKKALNHHKKAYAILENFYGSSHINTIYSQNNIGLVYHDMGKYKKALKYYKKSLDVLEIVFASEHPRIADAYHNIAGVYDNMGNFDKALDYNKKALAIREIILGKDHLDTAKSYNSIGSIYDSLGVFQTALEWYEKALNIRIKILGKEHPDVAAIYSNIGFTYHNMGNYSKALKYNKMALYIQEKILGKKHPDTATSYFNIGDVYHSMGEYDKALDYYEMDLVFCVENLGNNNTKTASSFNNIGLVYNIKKNYEKALEYEKKGLDIYEKIHRNNHPETATSLNNLGVVYFSMGDYPKALDFYAKAMAILEKVLGTDHPDTAISYDNIGGVYDRMGDHPKALEYYNKALSIREKVLDSDHPDTATTYDNIGGVYYNMGDYSKALEYYNKALSIREKVLDSDHPDINSTYFNIGVVYESIGNENKANEYYRKAGKHKTNTK